MFALAVVVLGLTTLALWVLPILLTRHPTARVENKDLLVAQNAARAACATALLFLGAATTAAYAARTYALSRDSQITERFTKAVAQLGDSSASVRLGGIHALERLMRYSASDQHMVIEVLAAFVRSAAALTDIQGPQRPRVDVQAALSVLGARTPRRDDPRVDLRDCQLRGANLRRVRLRNAQLSGSDLSDAILDQADLRGAYLLGCKTAGASFDGTRISGAHFVGSMDAHPLTDEQRQAARGWQQLRLLEDKHDPD